MIKKALFKAILIVLILVYSLNSAEIQVKGPFGMATKFYPNTMISKGNLVAIYGGNFENNKNFGLYSFFIFNGEKWETIPKFYIKENGEIDTLWRNTTGAPYFVTPSFDNESSFWFPGSFGFYQYKGSKIYKYSIPDKDSISDNYYYSHLRFDSSGNIILMRTKVLIIPYPPFDGYEIRSIWQLISYNLETGSYEILTSGENTETEIDYIGNLFITKDGEFVLLFKSNGFRHATLNIYSGNFELKESYVVPTPPYLKDSVNYLNSLAAPAKMFEDNQKNIWIGLSTSGNVGGLLKLNRKTGQWKAFYGGDGYPVVKLDYNTKYSDSLYFECLAIAQDKLGRIWVGGRYFLGIIDENEKIQPPEFIFDNLTLYPRFVSNEKQKPIFDKFLSDSLFDFLYKLMYKSFLPLAYVSEIGQPTVSGIVTTEDGSVWIAIDGLGIIQYKPLQNKVNEWSELNALISIYPQTLNRSEPRFNIKLNEKVDRFAIYIYDINGRRVFDSEFMSANDNEEFVVDLSAVNLSAGTYFIAVSLGDKIYFKKIVVY
ncbi:T9SS C-terminal target domain-containing protein [Bacteroidetes/Chlorobi group bacterium Naka2016]|jgi:hypothetical protein|nr:MAG: T9SS C-terminal target domain-containing protein [Bacteroidetes/Chlorobi group bacterium Naka2016]